jgi:hypothetical protein
LLAKFSRVSIWPPVLSNIIFRSRINPSNVFDAVSRGQVYRVELKSDEVEVETVGSDRLDDDGAREITLNAFAVQMACLSKTRGSQSLEVKVQRSTYVKLFIFLFDLII